MSIATAGLVQCSKAADDKYDQKECSKEVIDSIMLSTAARSSSEGTGSDRFVKAARRILDGDQVGCAMTR